MSDPSGTRETGEMGEAVAASLISDVLGGDLLFQHTPGEAPQGIDLAFLDDGGELHAGEVKSNLGDWHQPLTAFTANGRQMDIDWVSDRMDRVGIEVNREAIGADPDQVHTDLFQVDFDGDTIARYDMNSDGSRAETSPSEIFSMSDVLSVHESTGQFDVNAELAATNGEGSDDSEAGTAW